MVKFSAEEQKQKTPKRRCLPSSSCPLSDSGEEDGDAEEAAGAAAGDSREQKRSSGSRNGRSIAGKESATVFMDLDVLECPICYEILDPPIFQCENGHVACSSCCAQMSKCHSCSLSLGPTRCLALEKVLASIKLPCPFAAAGCPEIVALSRREAHRASCSKIPCHCPVAGCSFSGASPLLSRHLTLAHAHLVVDFSFARDHPLTFPCTAGGLPLRILIGDGGAVFVLLGGSGELRGSALAVVCVGPESLAGRFSYRLKAASGGSSIELESAVAVVRRWDEAFPADFFLLLPPGFVGGDQGGLMKVDVCVWERR